MITKFGTAKIVEKGEMKDFLDGGIRIRRGSSEAGDKILLDPERYLYVVNHSVSAYEYHGPNMNYDAFPEQELRERHYTFVGKPVTLDHISTLVVGTVIDSKYIEPVDPKNPLSGHFVQNVLAIDKKAAELVDPDLIDGILSGKITDTSMGAVVGYTICSICGAKAYTEHEYCPHISSFKGKRIRTASGEEKDVFEICRDVKFFEDSLIRPLEMGGLAGGFGADPNAKMRLIIATGMLPYRGKLPQNADSAQQVQLTDDHSLFTPEDIVNRLTQPPSPTTQTEPSPPEEDSEEKQYPVDTLKERVDEVRKKPGEPEDYEVVVEDVPNLLSMIPDDKLVELLSPLVDVIKTGSVSPEHEKAFRRVLEMVKAGIPVEKALRVVRDELQGDPLAPLTALRQVCPDYEFVGGDTIAVNKDCVGKCWEIMKEYDFTCIPKEDEDE